MIFGAKLIRAIQGLDPKSREAFMVLIEEVEKHLKESVTKEEFREFAQRTQENFDKVWQAIHELTLRIDSLAEAQKRAEGRLTRLEVTVAELAEAQKRAEERLTRLETTVAELAEAQRETERTLQSLIAEHKKTRENLGGLADTFGYYLENKAIHRLPDVLKEKYEIEVIGSLKREYLRVNKTFIEVNIFGKAVKDGVEFIVIGEAKNRLNRRNINNFIKKCEKIGGRQIRILVAHILPPTFEDYLRSLDIIFINSYEIDY